MKLISGGLIALVRLYQYGVSPFMPPHCRYAPSCSHYACEALRSHGALYGGWLTLQRILRCHPWGGEGYDPVPPAKSGGAASLPAPAHHHPCHEPY